MVPAANVYYLLCYAWDWLEGRDLIDLEAAVGDRVQDLLARALSEGVARLLRRGLDRAYVDAEEETRMPRGKILVSSSVKRNLEHRRLVACGVHELSHDILPNRLLVATMRRLAHADVEPAIARQLAGLLARFPQLIEVEPDVAAFDRVVIHRNNRHYAFLLGLCRLAVRNLLPTGTAGTHRFYDFRANPQEMGHLFQDFVRNFLRLEQRFFTIMGQRVLWDVEPTPSDEDLRCLPSMLTDVYLVSPGRRVVIEVKYPRDLFQSAWAGRGKLRSGHLYQLFSYLKNLEARGGDDRDAVGLLLYASAGRTMDLSYRLGGHDVHVHALDLTQPWWKIREDLLSTVQRLQNRH